MKIFNLLLLLLIIQSNAQTRDQVIARVVSAYASAEPLQYTTTYNLYKTHSEKNIIQSYKGYFCKNAKHNIFMKINNTEFLSTNKFSVKINHDDKAIAVGKGMVSSAMQEYDIMSILNYFDPGYFKDKTTYWEIEFISKTSSGLPYSKLLLQIGKDYFIQKQDFFYKTALNFSKNPREPNFQYPRLEVVYSKARREAISNEVFNTDKYFIQEGNKLRLTSKYQDYTLVHND